jgi:hypothetical protein
MIKPLFISPIYTTQLACWGMTRPLVIGYTVTEKGEAMTHFYQIRVRGHLSDNWAEWFHGLIIENQPDGDALLSGPVPDQAALHGLLIRIRDLGLPLLSVLCIEPNEDLHKEEIEGDEIYGH